MNRVRDHGNTVIFISHDLPEILDKSDTITILRDGVYIDTVKSADVNEDDLKKLMVGREVTGDYYRSDYGEKVSDEVVLSVKNVTVPGLIEDISFDLHKGSLDSVVCQNQVCMRSVKQSSVHLMTEKVKLFWLTEHTSTIFLQQLSTALLIHPKTVTMSRLC